jgi:hypothetical protein
MSLIPRVSDRGLILWQLVIAFALIVFGACLAAFGGLGGTITAIPLAVISAGAALLPGGASASANARISQAIAAAVTDIQAIQLAGALRRSG